MTTTDLIIIGAGPGGYRAAELAAKKGLKVVVIEASHVGGTCLNVGCIPTKTYVHAASFDEARQRMPQVVQQLRSGVESILAHPNITLVRGKAAFADAHTVEVQPFSPPSGGQGGAFSAPNIIIATGSATKLIPVEGLDDPRVVDSTGFLQLDTLPRRLCIIGAGVIGMEFASVFHRFGSEVTVVEYLKECLPALDSDIAKRLRKQMEKEGIVFHMQSAVRRIADGTVFFEDKKGNTQSVEADVILMATGRKPNTEGLNLEAAGIVLAPNGSIPVDDNYQVAPLTSHLSPLTSHLYAIGDVNGRQMLAHAAEYQAKRVVEHILGGGPNETNKPNKTNGANRANEPNGANGPAIPAAIFTTPEAACVGPTEDLLKQDGAAYECRKAFWRANGKALAMNETEGMLKLFSEPGAGRILGCHAYGAHSADIVQEVSALMYFGATVAQLRDIVHIHPTLSEVLLSAAEVL